MLQKESIYNQTSISIRDQKGAVSFSSSSLFNFKICLWYSMIDSMGDFFFFYLILVLKF